MGESIAFARLSNIYSHEKNPFNKEVNKDKAWDYCVIACFQGLSSPFGFEIEMRQFFADFALGIGDTAPKFEKTIQHFNQSEDPLCTKYKGLVSDLLRQFFDESITVADRVTKFRESFQLYSKEIDGNNLGAFLINMYSGKYEEDITFFDSPKLDQFFNECVINLFSLYNANFVVGGEIHALMVVGFAANAYHYLLWKGSSYKGEIDTCLHELIRMARCIVENH